MHEMKQHLYLHLSVLAKITFEIIGYYCLYLYFCQDRPNKSRPFTYSKTGHFRDMFICFDASKQMLTFPTVLCKRVYGTGFELSVIVL